MITKITIKNFKSIKDSGEVIFTDKLFVLAGQNESGKSSILEALKAFETGTFDKDFLNFEEVQDSNNEIQEVSCTYSSSDSDFADSLIDLMKDDFSLGEEDFIEKTKLELIKEYTITRKFNHSSNTLETSINKSVLDIVKNSIKNKETTEVGEDGSEIKKNEPFLDLTDKDESIADLFFRISPQIVLFNTFSDLLPDKILVSDLESKNTTAKGYNAVMNLEKLLDKDFVSISKLPNNHQTSTTSTNVTNLSDKFQKAWKQRIYSDGDLKIKFQIINENVEGQAIPTIFFYLETKDNVLLEPRKRSQGMIWFLSAWLELKSMEDDENKKVILYDEPGTHLHIKAHKDILDIFDELIKKGHQVIYSTHSPSLINTEFLHNIGLVINTKEIGTIVEGLTSSKINTEYKQDALQPVAEAMGLEPLKDFTVLSKKNVLLEGLSDFWYFQSMAKILGKEIDYKFVPGIGIKGNHIYHLISFCIGYGLDWLLVMDNGVNPQNTMNELKVNIFDGNEEQVKVKVKLISHSEIEDMFNVKDLILIDSKIKNSDTRKPSAIIGKRKIVFARDFAQKVSNEDIVKSNIEKTTIKNFEEVFEWIDQQFTKE